METLKWFRVVTSEGNYIVQAEDSDWAVEKLYQILRIEFEVHDVKPYEHDLKIDALCTTF